MTKLPIPTDPRTIAVMTILALLSSLILNAADQRDEAERQRMQDFYDFLKEREMP